MLNYLSLIVLIYSSFNAFGQHKIIDAETKKPVAYGYVTLTHKPIGTIADYNGVFKLNFEYSNFDTLKISCVGYEPVYVPVKNFKVASTIELIQNTQHLNEVVISAKKIKYKTKNIGVVKKPKTIFFDYSVTAENGVERATWIPNEFGISGRIKSVNIYVTDAGYPNAHFRIHVYNCSPFATTPAEELTTSNIISSGQNGNEWININLEKENITVGVNGCFIGVEWFDSPKSKKYEDTLTKKGVTYQDGKMRDTVYTHIRKGNGVVLGSISEEYKHTKNKIWYRDHIDRTWINWCTTTANENDFNIPDTLSNGIIHLVNESNLYYQVPCINVEVLFPSQKIKRVYAEPKKRKLNKIEKLEENNFVYPQSNISELFSSLIKAFEADDIIYALSYLCVYKKNELEEILAQLNIEKNSETILPYEERVKIIEHLKATQKRLDSSQLKKIDSQHFELIVDNYIYNLILDNGLWKINPYSYKIYE